jgi:hypothetical protein
MFETFLREEALIYPKRGFRRYSPGWPSTLMSPVGYAWWNSPGTETDQTDSGDGRRPSVTNAVAWFVVPRMGWG